MDNLPVVTCKFLCLRWFYLGGGVHFAFTWSVVPVIAAIICTETAVVCSFCLWLACFVTKISLLLNCFIMYLGGCCVSLLRRVLRWWDLWGVPLIHSGVICLCDGKLDILYLAEMMNHFIFCVV